MATTTHAVTTTSTANTTSYASGSFTPVANDLLVVFVVASGTVLASPTLTASANSMTFSLIAAALFGSSTSSVYAFVSNQLVPSSPSSMTVTFDCTGDAATGAIHFVYRVSGMTRTGLTAILQSPKVENHAVSGSTLVTFTSNVLTGNVTLLCLGNGSSPPALTEPTGWTEPSGAIAVGTNGDTGYSTPTTGGETCFRDSGYTGTTPTWGTNSASNYAIIGLELDTSAAATLTYPELERRTRGVCRGVV